MEKASCKITGTSSFSTFLTEYSQLLRKGAAQDQFSLQHFQGTNPVSYSVHNWLKASRENPVMRQAAALLQESNKYVHPYMFVIVLKGLRSN